jgi:hypothetical protein
MMRDELQKRLTGPTLLDWQWEMAHAVYQNHPDIDEVNGKGQIAEIINMGGGFEYPCKLREMYKAIGDKPIIVKTVVELLSTYDVTHNSYCINDRGNPMWGIYKAVEKILKEKYKELMDDCDYFSPMSDYDIPKEEREKAVWDIHAHWLIVHYVTGGSEGFYVHVAQADRENNRYRTLFLAKTLIGNEEAGRTWSIKMVDALSRIFQV